MRFKLALLFVGVIALVAMLAPGGGVAATKGGCAISGKANVSPGLTTKSKSFNFSFNGKLSSCQGTGAVKSGTVSASGTGSGTCASTSGKGTSSVKWNTGQTSSISFTFTGKGNVVEVTGKVTSGQFSGSNVKGPLAFTGTTPPPTACTGAGVTAFSFSGALELGI